MLQACWRGSINEALLSNPQSLSLIELLPSYLSEVQTWSTRYSHVLHYSLAVDLATSIVLKGAAR